jgi:mycofactocin system glycosyltransferase
MSLPVGFQVVLAPSVRRYDDGRTLVGSTRVVRLSAAAADLVGNGLRVYDDRGAVLADRLLALGLADPVVADLPPLDRDVTYVVPVRDRPRVLHRLLESVPFGAHVVVVDDASVDGAAIAAVAGSFGVTLIRLPVNKGPAAARNAGLARVTTPYLAFVDSDVVLSPGAVSHLLRHFHDPRVAMVAPRVSGTAGDGWVRRYEAAKSSLDLGAEPAPVLPRTRVSWLPSACVVVRVEALGSGFDVGLRVAEDVDLVWRLASDGWRVRYDPAVRVSHESRASVVGWLGRKVFYGTGADLLARRHGSDVAPAVLAPWAAVVSLSLLAQRRWSVPVAGASTLFAAGKLSRQVGWLGPSLALRGTVASLHQTNALLLRHWWPLTAVLALTSPRIRRAVVLGAVVDAAVEYQRTAPALDPVRFAAARRLDDLAYGAGLWLGALRGRSPRALLPILRGSRSRSRGLVRRAGSATS